MSDLKNKKLMYLKALLFLAIMIISASMIWLLNPKCKTALLLIILIWSAARLYYFMFYVIENYVDNSYKFSGIISFLKYLFKKKK